MLFVCISDKTYFPYACAFIASLLRNNPTYSIHYHLLNGTPEQIATLENERRITLSTEEKEFADVAELKRYAANSRFRLLAQLLEAGHSEVCYSDVDMIVRRPLDDIQQRCRGYDIGVWMRHDIDWPKPESVFNAALIWVNNSEESIAFFKRAYERALKIAETVAWLTDQIALYDIYVEDPSAINLLALPKTVNDENLNTRSHIWAGKWSCGRVRPAYAVEEAYHLALFKGEAPVGGRILVKLKLILIKITYPISQHFFRKVTHAIKRRVT